MNERSAISAINHAGILLVFPINNQKDPASLWTHFFPRSSMKWEWDEAGDSRVAELWHLRESLSRSGKVVYTKWFRGRATFFSKPLFTALFAKLNRPTIAIPPLSPDAQTLLESLIESSPLSTKELKKAADMQGKFFEGVYHKALGELWSRLLIVGYGEKDDGAFPSLNLGATQHLFEDLWNEAKALSETAQDAILKKAFPESKAIRDFWKRKYKIIF